MKLFKYITTGILSITAVLAFSTTSSALGVTESSSKEYLINHGHSQETVRMIELQQKRTLTSDEEINTNNKFMKIFKNLFYSKNILLPSRDFGHNHIITPESPRQIK